MYGSTLQAGMFGVMVVERRAGVARLAALGREDRSDAPQPAAEERRPRAAADTATISDAARALVAAETGVRATPEPSAQPDEAGRQRAGDRAPQPSAPALRRAADGAATAVDLLA